MNDPVCFDSNSVGISLNSLAASGSILLAVQKRVLPLEISTSRISPAQAYKS